MRVAPTMDMVFRTGQVTAEMLQLAHSMAPVFLIIGLFESIQLILFYTAASKLPGAVLPVLSQAGIVWNFILSALILKKGTILQL